MVSDESLGLCDYAWLNVYIVYVAPGDDLNCLYTAWLALCILVQHSN